MLLTRFVKTTQYGRFKEFCDACLEYGYIGLCYGAPGVGKTRSARVYAKYDLSGSPGLGRSVKSGIYRSVFYTAPVQARPGRIIQEISQERSENRLALPRYRAIEKEMDARIHQAKSTRKRQMEEYEQVRDYVPFNDFKWTHADEAGLRTRKHNRLKKVQDPTRLIIIDETDRLSMSSLEQVRDIFDRDGNIGVIQIGMPGLEKRLARYPQLYSRVGFVHEFKPLRQNEMRSLVHSMLAENESIDEEGIAALLRTSGGNFRLIERLMAQVKRVKEINELTEITADVVNAARESLVIGTD